MKEGNAAAIATNTEPKRSRGRPAGSKDKAKRSPHHRKDGSQFVVAEDDRLRIMKFNRQLFALGRVKDKDNYQIISDRVNKYLSMCEDVRIMPTVSGLALALGIDRVTLWDWTTNNRGTIKNPDVVNLLKNVYSTINAQYEELLTEGKMIPVSAFFLLQNNHGYKQQTDHVITASSDDKPTLPDIVDRAGLLTDE